MKKLHTILLIFLLLPLFSFSQDYWQHVYSIDTNYVNSLKVAKNGTIYFGSEKGLFISNDDGHTWDFKYLLNYISIHSLEFDIDSNLIVGASYLLYKYYIDSDSFAYETTTAPNYENFIAIYADSSGIFANGGSDRILIYKNSSWTVHIFGENAGVIYDIAKDTAGILYVATTSFSSEGGGVYRSLDNGDTWEYFGLDHYFVKCLAVDKYNRLYAGAIGHWTLSQGGFFRYNYETLQWDTLSHYAHVQSLYFNEEDSLYAGIYSIGGNGGAWMSKDYGDSWINISSGLTNTNFNVDDITEDSHSHLYAIVGDQRSIYKSADSTITTVSKLNNENFDEIKVYPNPFNDSFRFDLKEKLHNDQLTIHLFDILGREQKIIVNELENGCFKIQIGELEGSGFYILKIQSTTKVHSQKIFKY